jgi:hypothetical protein
MKKHGHIKGVHILLKKQIYFIAMILLLFALVACSDDEDVTLGQVEDDLTVATINGVEIKGDEYNFVHARTESLLSQQGQDTEDEKVAKQVRELSLNQVIGQHLVFQDAEEKGYKVSEEELTEELDKIKGQYENDEAYQEALKSSNLSEDKFKEQLTNQLIMDKYIEKEIGEMEVSEEEINSYYEDYKEVAKDKAEPLEDIKDVIKNELESQKQGNELNKIVQELKKESDVKIHI